MKLARCGAKSTEEATFVTVKLEPDVKKILTNVCRQTMNRQRVAKDKVHGGDHLGSTHHFEFL